MYHTFRSLETLSFTGWKSREWARRLRNLAAVLEEDCDEG